jgi:hypothetical protein
MTDPRDFDPRINLDRRADIDPGTPTPWAWIVGAVFIIVILGLVFTSGNTTRTARNDTSPPATTGMAPRTTPPLATVPPASGMPPAPSSSER